MVVTIQQQLSEYLGNLWIIVKTLQDLILSHLPFNIFGRCTTSPTTITSTYEAR